MKKLLALTVFILAPVAFICAQVSPIFLNYDKANSTLTFDFSQLASGQYFQAQNFGANAALGFGSGSPVIAANKVLVNDLVDHLGQPVSSAAVNGVVRQHEGFINTAPLTLIGFGNNTSNGGFTVAGGTITFDVTDVLFPAVENYFDNMSKTTLSNGSLQGGGSFELIIIPEPTTYALLAGLGVLGLAAWVRRRRVVARN